MRVFAQKMTTDGILRQPFDGLRVSRWCVPNQPGREFAATPSIIHSGGPSNETAIGNRSADADATTTAVNGQLKNPDFFGWAAGKCQMTASRQKRPAHIANTWQPVLY